MSHPAIAASEPPFLRRAFDWWLAQVKHALPPTIFFFVGFNLILWTKRLILEAMRTSPLDFAGRQANLTLNDGAIRSGSVSPLPIQRNVTNAVWLENPDG